MNIFRSKYRDLCEALQAELDEALRRIEIETGKRIAAETLAQERLKQVEKAYEFAFSAEKARDEAVKGRLASVDLVNTKLLESLGPEKAETRNIKDYVRIPKDNGQPVKARRDADMAFAKWVSESQRKKTHVVPEVPTELVAS